MRSRGKSFGEEKWKLIGKLPGTIGVSYGLTGVAANNYVNRYVKHPALECIHPTSAAVRDEDCQSKTVSSSCSNATHAISTNDARFSVDG